MRGKAVHNIVVDYLKDQSLDGLASDELGCDCELSDLAPCGDMRGTCLAARKHWLTVEDIAPGLRIIMRGKAVHNIVVDYLKDQSLDGLASDELGCDCELSDLAPCGDMRGTCLAARKHWLTPGLVNHISRDHVGHYWAMIAVERDPR